MATKTEAYKKVGSKSVDVEIEGTMRTGDFAHARNLGDLRQSLQTYEAELQNMCEWLSEEFGNPLNRKAISLLQRAANELRRLEKLTAKYSRTSW